MVLPQSVPCVLWELGGHGTGVNIAFRYGAPPSAFFFFLLLMTSITEVIILTEIDRNESNIVFGQL